MADATQEKELKRQVLCVHSPYILSVVCEIVLVIVGTDHVLTRRVDIIARVSSSDGIADIRSIGLLQPLLDGNETERHSLIGIR